MIGPSQLIDISDLFLGKKRARKLLRGMQDIEVQLTTFLSMILMCKYDYSGLPKELKYRKYLLEYMLYYYGNVALLKKDGLYRLLPCYQSSSLNMYGEATEYYAYGLNGQSFGKIYTRDEYDMSLNITHKQNAVLFKNNISMTPQFAINKPIIKRLVYLWQTMGIQNGLSRIKLLIYANSELAPRIKDTIDEIMGNSELSCVVPSEVGANMIEDIKESNFGTGYTPLDNWYDFDKTFSLLLSLNGIITNADNSKKERQTATEIKSGDMFTQYGAFSRRITRDIAIEECKEVFGLDIKIEDKVYEDNKEEALEMAKAYTGGEGGGEAQKDENKKPITEKKTPSKK